MTETSGDSVPSIDQIPSPTGTPTPSNFSRRAPYVLVVGDDPERARAVERAVHQRRPDALVASADTPTDAVEKLDSVGPHRARPALVLLDLDLPDDGAVAFLDRRQASQSLGRVPVVAIADHADREDIRAAYERHVNSCVVKNGSGDDLEAWLGPVLGFWLDVVRLPPVG